MFCYRGDNASENTVLKKLFSSLHKNIKCNKQQERKSTMDKKENIA